MNNRYSHPGLCAKDKRDLQTVLYSSWIPSRYAPTLGISGTKKTYRDFPFFQVFSTVFDRESKEVERYVGVPLKDPEKSGKENMTC